jgi:hypothetical protein
MYLWDQITYIKKSGRPALQFALRHCGVERQNPEAIEQRLPQILAAQKDNYIYHEIGELNDLTFNPDIWRELIAAFPHSPIELLARGLKDLLADTHQHGTLHRLVANRNLAGLGFYAAFLDGMLKELFPQLRNAFNDFTRTRNWRIIKDVAVEAHLCAKKAVSEMMDIFEAGKEKKKPQWARETIEKRLLAKILRKDDPDRLKPDNTT